MAGDNVTVASNVLGTIGTVLWCIQLIPQIWYNWRQKKTDGLPAAMMFLWASCMYAHQVGYGYADMLILTGSVPMGAYLILQVSLVIWETSTKEVGSVRKADCAVDIESQHTAANPAADIRRLFPRQLGPDLVL
jgi:hypothetical protein